MHILLLKEPRDEDSGPDPYIKVKILASFAAGFQRPSQVELNSLFESTGAGISRTSSHLNSCAFFQVCLLKHVNWKGKDLTSLGCTEIVLLLVPPRLWFRKMSIYSSALPTRSTRRSDIYESKSCGGCEEVPGLGRKERRCVGQKCTCRHNTENFKMSVCSLVSDAANNQIWLSNIFSEWNSSVKDKWNTKSVYVVGKATAALGATRSSSSFRIVLCFFCSVRLRSFPLASTTSGLITAECVSHQVSTRQKCVMSFGQGFYTSYGLLWYCKKKKRGKKRKRLVIKRLVSTSPCDFATSFDSYKRQVGFITNVDAIN